MLKWIRNKYLRHQDRRAMANAFRLLRATYPNLTPESAYLLKQSIIRLLDEYHFNWGVEDGYVRFYYKQLERITGLPPASTKDLSV